MKGVGKMSKAYRCSQCGRLRDGSGWRVRMIDGSEPPWPLSDGDQDSTVTVELCPDCAAPIRETLQAIAKTTHGV